MFGVDQVGAKKNWHKQTSDRMSARIVKRVFRQRRVMFWNVFSVITSTISKAN